MEKNERNEKRMLNRLSNVCRCGKPPIHTIGWCAALSKALAEGILPEKKR